MAGTFLGNDAKSVIKFSTIHKYGQKFEWKAFVILESHRALYALLLDFQLICKIMRVGGGGGGNEISPKRVEILFWKEYMAKQKKLRH